MTPSILANLSCRRVENLFRTIKSSVSLTVVVLLAFLALPVSLAGQGTSASLNGTVTDASGANVPGATVTLINVDTQTEQRTVSTEAGSYTLLNIQPGAYKVRAVKEGFTTLEKTGIVLQVNQTASLNFALAVGSTGTTVDVTAEVSIVDSSTAELGTVITEESVKDLPLNGRNFTQLLQLAPGISPVSVGQNAGGGSGFAGAAIGTYTFPSVNGQRNRSNMFLLDGVNDLAFIGNYNYSPIVDDIQEFKVQSHNDLAEFGQVAGGIINVASKPGTNNFHGSAWEFIRNEQLDARSAFQVQRNPLRQNQFGATFGGPVDIPHLYKGKDRTFFFFAYEGYHQSQNAQSIVQAPTAAQLNGDFGALTTQLYNPFTTTYDPVSGTYHRDIFQGNQIPQNLLSKVAVLYAKTVLPPAGATIAGSSNNLYDNTKLISKSNSYTGRIDQTFGTKDALFGRVSYSKQPITSSAGYPGALSTILIESWNFAAHESHSFTPTTTLDLSFGRNVGFDVTQVAFNRAPADFGSQLNAAGLNPKFNTGFLSAPGALIPVIGINGYTSTGGNNVQNTQLANTYEVSGSLSKILGRHSLKVGASYNSLNFYGPIAGANENFSATQTSNLTTTTGGDALASFLLGVPDNSLRRDSLEVESGGSIDGFYIQDQFKATSNLSINAGFRYDVSLWPEYGDLQSGSGYVGTLNLTNGTYVIAAQPPACSATVGAPCIPGGALPAHVVITPNKNRTLHNTDYHNFQGRLGLAYRVNDSLAVRAGYSRFYDEWNGLSQFAQNVGGNWPSVGLTQIAAENQKTVDASINDPTRAGSGAVTYPPPTPFGNVTFYFNPDMKTPYTDSWNLGIDQRVSANSTFSLAYVGSHGGRLDLGGIHNTARFPAPGDPATVATRRQYSYIAPTFYDDSTGNSNYHALQARLDGHTQHGLTYLISYTWSKSIDLAQSGDFTEGSALQDPYNPRADRSVSGFDLPNIFSGSVVYDLPFGRGKQFDLQNRFANYVFGGFQANAIVNLYSGQPFEVDVNGDSANTGNTFVHANLVGLPYQKNGLNRRQWLNPASFAAPPFATFGNGGRNSLRTDATRNLDLSLFRNFPIHDHLVLNFRAEAFNLTNSVVLNQPNSTLNSNNFGLVTSQRNNPRQIQFAAKLLF